MIYADALVKYDESWVFLSLRPEEIRSVTESESEGLGAPLGQRPTKQLRKSDRSIWQVVSVSHCLYIVSFCLSLKPQKLWLLSRDIKTYIIVKRKYNFFIPYVTLVIALNCFWRFEECRVTLHYNYFQVYS